MIIDHGPFPVFQCKCGKEVWGVNYDRLVVCGRCGSIMWCVNYDARGVLRSVGDGETKTEEEPLRQGSSTGNIKFFRKDTLMQN